MVVFSRGVKLAAVLIAVLLAMLLAGATPSQAQTTGSVRLHIVKAGFIIGVGGGNGVLTYRGKTF